MKTLKTNKLILLLLGLTVLTSCVENDDFNTPNTIIIEPNILETAKRQIATLAGELAQEQGNTVLDYTDENTTYTYTFNEDDLYMEGYVISSDEAGNFFEELIIQDRAENPTLGIKLLIDVNPLFVRYQLGQKIYIKLNGLSVGITNGVLTLGALDGNTVDKIPSVSENDIILRSTQVISLVPLVMDITEFTNEKTNLLVQLSNIQFERSQVLGDAPMSYASEAFDEFDGERSLQSCSTGANVIFSTSTFADFKGLSLPSGSGTMTAILTKNFEGELFIVTVNSPENLILEGSDRCGCGLTDASGTNTLFYEDFETQSNNSLISGNGWTNYIQDGTEGWEAFTSASANASLGVSARASSFGSNDTATIAWLITPEINLDAQNDETLSFMTSNSFADNSFMNVLISTNWNGASNTVLSATWEPLVDATIISNATFFGSWIPSGNISLECYTGMAHIAFIYTGNDIGNDDFNGTYELDEIEIKSN